MTLGSQLGFGIDFGGTGCKGAPVDLDTGEFVAVRVRVKTPEVSTPAVMAGLFAEIMADFPDIACPIGITVPGVVRNGVVSSAANIDSTWIGTNANNLFTEAMQREVYVTNDADAAGLAELHYGAARGHQGLVIVTTLGTGIGSALLFNGKLVPNSELGHLEIDGHRAESWAANSVREMQGLSWQQWADRLSVYYRTLEKLFSPELFVLGGGVSKESAEFVPLLKIDTPVVPATLRNQAGIIGAAYHASLSSAMA
jgi:polyphosphate glucokinase